MFLFGLPARSRPTTFKDAQVFGSRRINNKPKNAFIVDD